MCVYTYLYTLYILYDIYKYDIVNAYACRYRNLTDHWSTVAQVKLIPFSMFCCISAHHSTGNWRTRTSICWKVLNIFDIIPLLATHTLVAHINQFRWTPLWVINLKFSPLLSAFPKVEMYIQVHEQAHSIREKHAATSLTVKWMYAHTYIPHIYIDYQLVQVPKKTTSAG